MMNKIYFHEKQKFAQWWLWLLLLVVGWSVFRPIAQAFKENQSLTSGQWIGLIVILLVLLLFYVTQLETKIHEEGIDIRFVPFIWKTQRIQWSAVTSVFVRKYSPLVEYGGWGWRVGAKGKAYNVKGNQGLQLVFKNRKALLIGTQQPEALQKVLNTLKEKGCIAVEPKEKD